LPTPTSGRGTNGCVAVCTHGDPHHPHLYPPPLFSLMFPCALVVRLRAGDVGARVQGNLLFKFSCRFPCTCPFLVTSFPPPLPRPLLCLPHPCARCRAWFPCCVTWTWVVMNLSACLSASFTPMARCARGGGPGRGRQGPLLPTTTGSGASLIVLQVGAACDWLHIQAMVLSRTHTHTSALTTLTVHSTPQHPSHCFRVGFICAAPPMNAWFQLCVCAV
jgi:hypothetical protein